MYKYFIKLCRTYLEYVIFFFKMSCTFFDWYETYVFAMHKLFLTLYAHKRHIYFLKCGNIF